MESTIPYLRASLASIQNALDILDEIRLAGPDNLDDRLWEAVFHVDLGRAYVEQEEFHLLPLLLHLTLSLLLDS